VVRLMMFVHLLLFSVLLHFVGYLLLLDDVTFTVKQVGFYVGTRFYALD